MQEKMPHNKFSFFLMVQSQRLFYFFTNLHKNRCFLSGLYKIQDHILIKFRKIVLSTIN